MNLALEPADKSLPGFAAYEVRRQIPQMRKHRPEQLLCHDGGPFFVCVREVVARGRSGPTDAGERPGVQLQRIADIVEANTMRELGVAQGNDVTPGREGSPHVIDVSFAGDFRHHEFWNEVVDLPEQDTLGTCWNVSTIFRASPKSSEFGKRVIYANE